MSAELDYSNGRVNFAYVLEHGSPWHGEGQIVPLNSPIETWKKEAGLEWEAYGCPVVYYTEDKQVKFFPKRKVLYRNDTSAPLSIVSDDYRIVQPGEIVDFFYGVLEQHNMEMSSCGSLFGGKRFFATAKLKDFEIIKGDVITGYLLITTSLDGTLATVAKITSIRTVCNNTLTMAMNEKNKNMVKVIHSTTFNPDKVKLDLGLIEECQFNFITNMQKLANVSCTPKQAEDFYKEMFFEKGVSEQSNQLEQKVENIMNLYKNGNGSEFGKNTYYNVLQGITDYFTNSTKPRTESAKFWNSFYGVNDQIKLDAQNKLLEIVN
jgi:phage/plasmid-like protein (TIGR03299 family)